MTEKKAKEPAKRELIWPWLVGGLALGAYMARDYLPTDTTQFVARTIGAGVGLALVQVVRNLIVVRTI